MDLGESIQIDFDPQLMRPSLVAAWPGMGGVAAIAAKSLKDQLGAQEFGHIEPYPFYEPTAVRIRKNVLEEPQFPESKFYFWKGEGGRELILLTSDAQPATRSHELGNLIIDVAETFGVRRVYTSAAAPAHIHYARTPRVLGVATSPELLSGMEEQGVTLMDSGTISGMNGVLLGIAKKRGMDGICLLGEIPIYMTEMANPRAAKGIIETLSNLLGTEVDTSEMDEWIRQLDAEVEKNIARFMTSLKESAQKFVDYLERLKEMADAHETTTTAELPEYSEELLKEVEQFLKEGQAGKDEDIG